MDKDKIWRWARGIAGVGVIVTFIMAVFGVVSVQIIPLGYVIAATVIGTLAVILLSIALFRKQLSKGKSIAAVIIAILLTAASLYAFSASNAMNSFLNSLEGDDYTYIEYSMIAKESEGISLSTSSTQQVGLLETDPHSALVKEEVEKRTGAEYTDYGDISSMTDALDNGDTSVITLQSSYLELLEENNERFYSSIEVLATFTIQVEKEAQANIDTTQPFVVYISGIDTDGPISSVSRSDVNILAVVNPQTSKILLVNTPRDYYVQLHGTTGARDKLTHAGIYGVETSKKTLENLYNVPIDYHLRINFASLTNLVDTLGGINVYSDYDFKSQSYEFTKGYNYVTGEQALDFARTRKAFTDGDRVRGQNQQRVIEAIIHKLSSPETLVNHQNILRSLEGTFQTNANSGDIAELINQQLNSITRWDVESISVDGTGTTAPTYSMGDLPLYVMEPDDASVQAAQQRIQQTLAK